MGIFEWVKGLTGNWGPALLGFYIHHAYWINGLLILYGLMLVLSWKNLERIRDDLVEQILAQARHGSKQRKAQEKPKTYRIKDFRLSWEQALACSRFPLVAHETGLRPRQVSMDVIRQLITEDDLIRRSVPRLAAIGVDLKKRKK